VHVSWPSKPIVIVVDVSALADPDELALEALARLQLTARRLGASIRLHGACGELADLLDLVGLSDVLPVAESGIDTDRHVEEREQPLVDEEVDPGDATA
jgi:anti-anti-sigma regulatory factor